jgi:hypothetical protein
LVYSFLLVSITLVTAIGESLLKLKSNYSNGQFNCGSIRSNMVSLSYDLFIFKTLFALFLNGGNIYLKLDTNC